MSLDLNGPAAVAPAGESYQLDNPPNMNGLAYGVLVTCVTVATICLLLRLYGRCVLLRKIEIEEILVTAAYGCYWGAAYCTFALVETPGYFVHTWNVRLKDTIPTQYYVFVFGVCYSFVLPLLKCAILVEWCRMFVPRGNRTKSPFYWGCVVVIFVQITAAIAIVVALNLQCIPHSGIWDFTIATRKCFPLYPLQVASASIQLISDVAIFCLPQRVIWTLRMSWQKRLGVSFVFGLGLLACVSAAFRLATTVAYGNSTDSIYSLGPLVFWCTAELTCGFFICCVPCMPKILKETGVIRTIKRAFGAKTTAQGSKGLDYYGTNHSTKNNNTSSTSKAYYKLDEEGVAMNNLPPTESTEQLNKERGNNGITRTTRITVTNNDREGSDNGSADMPIQMGAKAAWR
ncbi:hypothetical protein F4780DRAFT_795152 [Xylariomycetidae sp. FL0641]|nr:hypothetical protein F4780DRAFT_795152 [Xylariomycetidae sp. FL0641]